MIRVVIDRVTIHGLAGLREKELRQHLAREIAACLADLPAVETVPGRPLPIVATNDPKRLARSIALSLREVLDGR